MKIEATYEVTYTFKKVRGASIEVTGEIKNGHFHFTAPIKSFVSGDSDQDSHMLEVTEATLFPNVMATGTMSNDHVDAEIDFHGVKRSYQFKLEKQGKKASFILNLEAHGIKRPSLLGIKIKNDVLMTFKLP